uniref:Uncharacterized protein n=1 Tax=Rhizophora mucronata TaxID=61149 RepID=A0A2P2JYB0_RHIMU
MDAIMRSPSTVGFNPKGDAMMAFSISLTVW